MPDDAPKNESAPWLGMVFVWFFFNLGFIAFFTHLLAMNGVFIVYEEGRASLNGFVWLLVGCFALALVFAAPKPSSKV